MPNNPTQDVNRERDREKSNQQTGGSDSNKSGREAQPQQDTSGGRGKRQ